MTNILTAISNIEATPCIKLENLNNGRNRINNIGEAFEVYIQDAFANTITEANNILRNETITKVFSYLGNQNNPPDGILRNGDAIEVKKIQNSGSSLALNSSFPKDKLYSNDPKITSACRHCENWMSKDIIYAVGVTNDNEIRQICFVYGDCYAANKDVYSRIGETIKNGIVDIPDVEFSETKELGRVNKVDPLGITNLRVRGMWHIDNPMKVFKYIHERDEASQFSLSCIMKLEKYNSFVAEDRQRISNNPNINVQDVRIKNPNNPAQLMDAKLISIEKP